MAFAGTDLAVKRWQVTSSIKTQVINSLLEIAEIKNYNTETKELNQSTIERNH